MKFVKLVAQVDGKTIAQTIEYPLEEAIEDQFMDVCQNIASQLMETYEE